MLNNVYYFIHKLLFLISIVSLTVSAPNAVAATFNASCSSSTLTLSDRVVKNFPNDVANFTNVTAGTIFRVTNSYHSGPAGNGIQVTHSGNPASPVSINLNSDSGDPPSSADFTVPSAGNIQFQINLSGSLATNIFRRQLWSITCIPGPPVTAVAPPPAVEQTSQMIADYQGARNTLLLDHQPDRQRRLNKLEGGQADASTVHVAALGIGVNSPLPFNVAIGKESSSLAGGFSMNSRWDIWTEGHIARFNDDTSQDGKFGVIYAGIDYLINPHTVVGVMAQYDRFNQKYSNKAKVHGSGWMVGPYTTLRLGNNFYFDARAAWGRSSNKIKPFGTYKDKFSAERWLVSAALIGEFFVDSWSIRPGVSFQYIEEKQSGYTDSLNARIPGQTIAQGDIRFGPRIGYHHQMKNGSTLNPWFELTGVYSFSQQGHFSNGSLANEIRGLSGTFKTGLSYITMDDITLTLSGQYGGIGTDVQTYGGMLKIAIPLGK